MAGREDETEEVVARFSLLRSSESREAVLRLIAAGNSNKEIAVQLSVAEETVKGRVKNILSKLDANDRTHAAMIAMKRGIIDA